jgi:GTP-binding nuclear protein Ran
MEIPSFKCVLMGDGGVGKSTFVKKHLTGQFETEYIPTLGVEVRPLVFNTSKGPLRFNIWDTAGQKQFGGLRDGYYIGAHCAIIMFDVTSTSSYEHVSDWYHDLDHVCDQIPVVLVGNKCDLIHHMDHYKHYKTNLLCHEISSKSDYHFGKPFLMLARQLLGDETIDFL